MTQTNTFSLIRDVLSIVSLALSVNPSNGEALSHAQTQVGNLQGALARASDNPSLTGTPLSGDELAWIGDLFGNVAASPAIAVPAAPTVPTTTEADPAPTSIAQEVATIAETAAPVLETDLTGAGQTAAAPTTEAAPVATDSTTGGSN